MTALPPWEGHPWNTAEHRTVGSHRARCKSCGTWCYPTDGCWCCNEPAWEWLLAESRVWADRARAAVPLPPARMPFPWEAE